MLGLGRIHIEKEGDVRKPGSSGKSVDLFDDFGRDPSGGALIDGGRVQKAVRDNDFPSVKGGKDFLPHELSTTGGKEEKLGLRLHGAAFR